MIYRERISRNTCAALSATVIGVAALVGGPAQAESTLGDQSFDRGIPATAQPSATTTVQPVATAARGVTDWSMASREGVRVEVLAEHPADLPGIDKVQVRKLTLEPGASLANFVIAERIYCISTKGEVAVTDHDRGTTATYGAGEHWSIGPGRYTLSSTGDTEHSHDFYSMVMPPLEAWEPSGFRGARYMGAL